MIIGDTFEISFPELEEVVGSVVYATDLKVNYFMSGAQRETRCCDCEIVP